MGFARSLGLGIRDFLSVPARSLLQVMMLYYLFEACPAIRMLNVYVFPLQSPTGLISGMALGTTSLVSNTVYALSDAATQFSKAAHKVFLLSGSTCATESILTDTKMICICRELLLSHLMTRL